MVEVVLLVGRYYLLGASFPVARGFGLFWKELVVAGQPGLLFRGGGTEGLGQAR